MRMDDKWKKSSILKQHGIIFSRTTSRIMQQTSCDNLFEIANTVRLKEDWKYENEGQQV